MTTQYSLAKIRWISRAHVQSDIQRNARFTWELLDRYGTEEKAVDLMRKYIADIEPDEPVERWSEQALRRRWNYYRKVGGLKVVKVKSKT